MSAEDNPDWWKCGGYDSDWIEEIVKNSDYDTRLAITAWVMEKILDHAKGGGSYRYLIYDRLGFDMDAYGVLQNAGALEISNEFDIQKMIDIEHHVRAHKIESMKPLVGICDEPGCYKDAGCGFPVTVTTGVRDYRWTCSEHWSKYGEKHRDK